MDDINKICKTCTKNCKQAQTITLIKCPNYVNMTKEPIQSTVNKINAINKKYGVDPNKIIYKVEIDAINKGCV